MHKYRTHLYPLLLAAIVVGGCDRSEPASEQASTPAETPTTAANPAPAPVADNGLGSDLQKLSYTIGTQIGQNMQSQQLDMDEDALIQGIVDSVTGAELKLTMPEMEQAVTAYMDQEQQRQQDIANQNLATGEAFLAENRKNADVTETASGLQYKVLTAGTGTQPKASDSVVVHYRGTLVDGTEFDSSYSRGEPITISLDQVIPGWQEAIPLMPVGSKWQVVIPSSLGYGENASGPIGPNSTLIFDVELLSIAEAPTP